MQFVGDYKQIQISHIIFISIYIFMLKLMFYDAIHSTQYKTYKINSNIYSFKRCHSIPFVRASVLNRIDN